MFREVKGVVIGCALLSVTIASLWGVEQARSEAPSQPVAGASQITRAEDRPLNSLRDLNNAFVDLASAVTPSVVTVSTARTVKSRSFTPFMFDPFSSFFGNDPFKGPEQEYRQQGLGSGVIVSADGYILTNNHVVAEADSIQVQMVDGRMLSAKVVGTDPKTDIAVIRVDAQDLPAVAIGNSDNLKVGEMVLAIGSPIARELASSVTMGIVSAVGRSNVGLADYEDFIQVDAAINPGNSGGALVNIDGELVGINTAIASRTGGFQGIGFAVPVNMAQRVMSALITKGRVVRGYLGVNVQDVSPEIAAAMRIGNLRGGALIGDVVPDSPADRAGIQPGDVIIEMNGSRIEHSSQLRNNIATTDPGSSVDLRIYRSGQEKEVTATLGELPADGPVRGGAEATRDLLGFTVAPITEQLAQQYDFGSKLRGVVVTSIDPNCAAFQAGLREGDVIRAVNQVNVSSPGEFASAISGFDRGETVLLQVTREHNGFFLAFQLN